MANLATPCSDVRLQPRQCRALARSQDSGATSVAVLATTQESAPPEQEGKEGLPLLKQIREKNLENEGEGAARASMGQVPRSPDTKRPPT